MNALIQLHDACAAVAPIFGVSSDRISFQPEATQQQRDAAQAILSGWDFSELATEQRKLAALKRQASAAIERSETEGIEIDKAIIGYVVAYTNQKLTTIADLLQARSVINQAQRDNFVNGLATRQDAVAAIKTRIEAN